MKLTRSKLIAIGGLLILLLMVGYWLYPSESQDTGYIFDKTYDISLEDVQKARTPFKLNQPQQPDASGAVKDSGNFTKQDTSGGENLRNVLSEGLINAYATLNYFKHLEHKFRKSQTMGDHLEQVHEYLLSEFSEPEAEKLFEIYQKYLQTEMDLVSEFNNLSQVRTPEEAIAILRRIQEFRRERLGVELADKLFGADVKSKEYAFRRASIVANDDMYGSDKETQIEKLNQDMWGDEAQDVEKHPNSYNRYQEKIKIYEKDFDEMASEEAREQKIKEFRNEFFSPEVVGRMEAVDQEISQDQQKEENYRQAEQKIMADTEIAPEEKEQRIKSLQQQTFGDEADAFQRRENMRKELERLKSEGHQAR